MASQPTPAAGSISVVCPRCGYDLRGQLAVAHTPAVDPPHPQPLSPGERGVGVEQGTCSECGLTFLWRDVTDPMRNGPAWCIEYEPSLRRLPLAAVNTWLRMLWPWGFWSRLQMHHEPRWRRIGLMYLFALVPVVVLYVAFQASVAVYVRARAETDLQQNAMRAPQMVARYQAAIAALPTMGLSPEHQAAERTRYQVHIANWQARMSQPSRVEMSYLRAIVEAVFTPMSFKTSGTVINGSFVDRYPSPFELPGYLPARHYDFWKLVRFAMIVPIPFLLTYLFFPVSLWLLPVSRKRAKVRWRHIWRITAYSGVLVISMATLVAIFGAGWAVVPAIGSYMDRHAPVWIVFAPFVILMLWWGTAIGRYLRIPHAWPVAILLTVLSGLAGLMSGGVIISLIEG